MRDELGLILLAIGVGVGTYVMRATPPAQNTKFRVIDRDAIAYGRTYSEWSAAWVQWAYSIPVKQHPLFGNADCGVGQSGPVWFLGGKFCANGEVCSYDNVVRTCAVPADKALYFPVFDSEDSALEERLIENPGNPKYQQITALRSVAESNVANAALSCTVDGIAVPKLQEKFRVQSPVFGFTLPADNLLTSFYGTSFPEGFHSPAVDDGWYVMLAPLSPGRHVIQFRGTAHGNTIGVKYNLDVR
jgi:hypothetical protein